MRVARKMLGSVCCMAIILVFLLSGMTVYAEEGLGVWTSKGSMSIARDGHKLANVNFGIYSIGGNDENGPLDLVEKYDSTSNTWIKKAPMNSKRSLHQVAVIYGRIYVIGGCDENGIIGSVEEYNPSTDTWTTKASMNVKRCDVRVAVIGEKIYVIGGDDGTSYSNVVEEYDPAKDIWTTKAPMSVRRSDHQLAVINGLIYAIGGNDGENYFLDSVEVYNPATDTWSEKAPMKTKRQSHVVKVMDGKIYAIGGNTPSGVTNSAEEYDPVINEWKAIASMAEKRYYHQVAVMGNRIYAIGGCDGINYLDSVEQYVPAVNSWIKVSSLPEVRNRHEVMVVSGKIYTIGGSNSQLLNSVVSYTPNAASEPPANLTTAADKGGINLSWQVITGSAIYNIMRATTEGGIYTSIATSASISYTDTSVTEGNTYYYRVTAINDGGESPSSNTASASLPKTAVSLGVASVDKAALGDVITADIVINNAVNICAEDIKINYDTSRLEFISAEGADGIKIFKEDNLTEGIRRYIAASLGKSNAANGDKVLLKLTFKVKGEGSAKIDIVSGRIADNSTLEEDIAQADCGEKTILIEERIKDVDRSGKFTLLDLAIDAWYYGEDVASTDTSKYDADVIVNGKIDDADLTEIVRMITESQTSES